MGPGGQKLCVLRRGPIYKYCVPGRGWRVWAPGRQMRCTHAQSGEAAPPTRTGTAQRPAHPRVRAQAWSPRGACGLAVTRNLQMWVKSRAALAPSGAGPVASSSPSPEAGARGARSPSGGADAQRLRGGTWPGLGPSLVWGGAWRPRLAAAGGDGPRSRGGGQAGDSARHQPPARPPLSGGSVLPRQTAEGGARPLAGPELQRRRGARPRGGERGGSGAGGARP